jgi:hypothetical protein
MEQIEMKQMLEHLMTRMEVMMYSNQHEMKVQIGGLASKMDADKAEAVVAAVGAGVFRAREEAQLL